MRRTCNEEVVRNQIMPSALLCGELDSLDKMLKELWHW
jgi:hypothetical protein